MMLTNDGLRLHTIEWPVEQPKANFYLIHGYAEHSGRYSELVERLNQLDISVYSFDLRGFGRSEGEAAYIDHFDQYTNDVNVWVKEKLQRNIPHFIFGHSLGGLIAISFLLKYTDQSTKFNGVILSGPALMPAPDIAPILIKFSKTLGSLFPKAKTIKLEADRISKDPLVVQAYEEDPFVYHGKWIAKTGSELIRQMNEVHRQAEDFTYPIMIGHGDADRLANIEGSKKFIAKIASEDKSFKAYPDMHHELLNEPEKEIFLGDIVNWIKNRI